MPYITPQERVKLDPAIDALVTAVDSVRAGSMAGYLNYAITRLLLGTLLAEPSYLQIATATGVLENVKQEMYRRLAAPYEDTKRADNGDVYE